MLTILRYFLMRNRGQILGWGLGLAIYGAFLLGFYDTFAGQKEELISLFKNYPPELMAFFGGEGLLDMFSPSGFINLEFFSYMTIIIGIFSVLTGSGLLAGDEENGNLDLLLAYPISRSVFFWGRMFGFILATVAIVLLAWLGFVILEPGTTLNLTPIELLHPFISLFGLLMLFGALAVLLSLLLPSRRQSAMLSGLLLIGSYFLTSLQNINKDLEPFARFSPNNYYQGGLAIDGMNWEWFAGLAGFAVLFILLAWWKFERRDIRVAGEGSWYIPGLSRSKRAPQPDAGSTD